MTHDHLPDLTSDDFDQKPHGIKEMLEEAEAKADELEAAWIQFNKTQPVGSLGAGIDRRELAALTNELSQDLPFLQSQYDSDSLGSTNAYLIVLKAQQVLQYSLDRLGMV